VFGLHFPFRKPDLSDSARDLARVKRIRREARRRAIIDEMRAMQGKPAWKWGPL
jgi:hypothetical protein